MLSTILTNTLDIGCNLIRYNIAFAKALTREREEFVSSLLLASKISLAAARENHLDFKEIIDVMSHTSELMNKGMWGSLEKLTEYSLDLNQQGILSLYNSITNSNEEHFHTFVARETHAMEAVATFHENIENIASEFGFHFYTKGYNLIHDTNAFELWQIMPTKPNVLVNDYKKPVLLVPPYMLGAHILSFLPKEDKSYAHSFANEGIPTYVRIVKNIAENEDVQNLTPEEDCLQTMELCSVIKHRHQNQKVTLNGTCQGGYICLMNILSGHLTEVVDGLITNVTPIDGTYSRTISGVPQLHSDFITRTLPNGARVADGYLLSLGMRYVAIDRETPLVKVLNAAALQKATGGNPGKTVAALFRWLTKERVHLPLAIAKMSSCTFQQPISENGVLPVKLFGESLNLKHLGKMGVKWYQNYALKDDLVTPPCATAGNKFVDPALLESVPFPGGHVAILTSPYNKKAPVNGRFISNGKEYRGPVTWQLEFGN